jgi:hypothetical protein
MSSAEQVLEVFGPLIHRIKADTRFIELPFSYGDATPKPLSTALTGKLIHEIQIHIVTPFDGVGAALTVGDAGDPARLMAADQVDPATVATYAVHPGHRYESDTQMNLFITPGEGATQGDGLAIIYVER